MVSYFRQTWTWYYCLWLDNRLYLHYYGKPQTLSHLQWLTISGWDGPPSMSSGVCFIWQLIHSTFWSSDIVSAILSDINSDLPSDIDSDVSPGILSEIFSEPHEADIKLREIIIWLRETVTVATSPKDLDKKHHIHGTLLVPCFTIIPCSLVKKEWSTEISDRNDNFSRIHIFYAILNIWSTCTILVTIHSHPAASSLQGGSCRRARKSRRQRGSAEVWGSHGWYMWCCV